MGRPSSRNAWCRHRTPFDTKQYPVCKAGVDYHTFDQRHDRMPCLGETPQAKAGCDQYSGYMAEEIAAAEAERTARFARMGTIREAIMAEHETTGSNGGQMPCPACKTGTVAWSRARSNGHVHARCTTPDCAAWME